GKRTDLMGLLLLISPPGYGKTTLMEYIANRLGVTFAKINGPAIGHAVTSLDPEEAPNAGAREELKKLNLSLEMGNNLMIYVDDIQHCNPEFLQKFISLCDAQRKIEGVYNGVSRTYDLRGKKIAVVMAGNPYTESGEKFQIPDMLANRADVYNLGDMMGAGEEAFKLSYIENSLTSNPILNKLITRSRKDVYLLIDAARTGDRENLDLEGNYSSEEVNEFIAVLTKLLRVRDVVLDVNMAYIRSAAQAEEYRSEPSFKLQGSYRNMNRIAEKVLPVMNDAELEHLILQNYENDSQTLTTGAEANMLKFKELVGHLHGEEEKRWLEIKSLYAKNRLVKSDDTAGQVVLQLNELGEGLGGIRDVISKGFEKQDQPQPVDVPAPVDQPEMPAMETEEIMEGVSQGFNSIKESIDSGFDRLGKNLETFTIPVPVPAPAPPAPATSVPNKEMIEVLTNLRETVASVKQQSEESRLARDLDVTVKTFNIVTPGMAARLNSKAQPLLSGPVDFENRYRLLNVSVASAGEDRILLLTLECLKTTLPEADEKFSVTLLKKGEKLWTSSPEFRGDGSVYREGEIISGRIKLSRLQSPHADHLGIRFISLGEDDQWQGMLVLGDHPTDLSQTRLLIPVVK
ncbi:MAG: AAA family ATPase, partial [bacterium]|nr:AAA family ATPase [bacterium]